MSAIKSTYRVAAGDGGTEGAYRQWIAALRSGQYQQGQMRLRNSDGFCCLGVLCDLEVKLGGGTWEMRTAIDGFSSWVFNSSNGFEVDAHTYLPASLKDCIYLPRDSEGTLAGMNDEGRTFAQIADYIEAEVMPTALRLTNRNG